MRVAVHHGPSPVRTGKGIARVVPVAIDAPKAGFSRLRDRREPAGLCAFCARAQKQNRRVGGLPQAIDRPVGQTSSNRHSSQRSLPRAGQRLRPWRIIMCESSVHAGRGNTSIRSRSIFTGSD